MTPTPLCSGRATPEALGQPASRVWAEILDVVGPQTEIVMREGQATWNESTLLVMERYGYTEETYCLRWSIGAIARDGVSSRRDFTRYPAAGYEHELIERLKALDAVNGAKFIALSGYRDGDAPESVQFDHFLEKPLDSAKLDALLRSMVN